MADDPTPPSSGDEALMVWVKLLGLLVAPATTLVRLLNTPGGQIARVLDARREKLAAAAPAPAAG